MAEVTEDRLKQVLMAIQNHAVIMGQQELAQAVQSGLRVLPEQDKLRWVKQELQIIDEQYGCANSVPGIQTQLWCSDRYPDKKTIWCPACQIRRIIACL